MKNPFDLNGETALITGGGSGIGFGIASCFVESGARVILVGRNQQRLVTAADQLGDRATWEQCDVTLTDRAPGLIEKIEKRIGSVTILVNNAGNHLKKTALETSPEEFDSVLQTHVSGAFALTRAVLPGMIERRHGNILFIASMASLFGIPMISAYAAAKSAHLGLVRTLAVEYSSQGVRINGIAPGWIETEMVQEAGGDRLGCDFPVLTCCKLHHRRRPPGRRRHLYRFLDYFLKNIHVSNLSKNLCRLNKS